MPQQQIDIGIMQVSCDIEVRLPYSLGRLNAPIELILLKMGELRPQSYSQLETLRGEGIQSLRIGEKASVRQHSSFAPSLSFALELLRVDGEDWNDATNEILVRGSGYLHLREPASVQDYLPDSCDDILFKIENPVIKRGGFVLPSESDLSRERYQERITAFDSYFSSNKEKFSFHSGVDAMFLIGKACHDIHFRLRFLEVLIASISHE